MRANLATRLADPSRGVYFVGTTPPKAKVSHMDMNIIADKLLNRLTSIDYDGLVVYDIQDESARNGNPRPFPFNATHDSRVYSNILTHKSNHPTITYKSVSTRSADDFNHWLEQTWSQYDIKNIVLVGSPSSIGSIKLPLKDAYTALSQHDRDFNLGGVAIAERHDLKGDEHARMHQKAVSGCNFFITQAVYNADATIDLLQQYSALCKEKDIKPNRVILTFSPCGSEKTLDFIHWLGISTPSAVRTRILDAKDSLAESINICEENLKKIIDYCINLDVPLGLNIESLTNRKEEIDASIKLFKLLKATLDLNLAKRY